MKTYGYISPEETQHTVSEPRKRRSLFLWILFIILALGMSISATAYFTASPLPENPEAYDPETLTVKPKTGILHRLKSFVFSDNAPETSLKGFEEDRINILLLGVGGPGHDGPYLSDTIILASIKPSTKQMAFISIPRDLQVTIPGAGVKKINYANAYGEMKKTGTGGSVAARTIEDIFGITIHYYATVDFTAFEETIDHVGGISVHVDKSFNDPLFPTKGDLYQTISFSAGTQTMNGKTALTFARSRHGNNGEGSDFARSKRQQKVILALKEKVLSFETLSHPVQIYNMMKTIHTHSSTNMTFGEIISFVRLAKTFSGNTFITLPLDDSPQSYLRNTTGADGAFYLVFKQNGKEQAKEKIANIFSQTVETANIDTTPAQEAPKLPVANIEIQNGTWQAGLAARLKDTLIQKEYVISALGNTAEKPKEKSGIYAISPDAPFSVLQILSTELRMPVREILSTSTLYATSTDILIIIGDDWITQI